MFRTLGYPESVADLLCGLCTTIAPPEITRHLNDVAHLYSRAHLPQGSPTSPALSNICSYRLDCPLTGLANSANAAYTRYADDLAFSGGQAFARHIDNFSAHVAAILMEEGFSVHHHKTRVMRQGVRQHLAGIVVNEHPNVIGPDFDRLKAILTNCLRHGTASQNRGQHPSFRAHIEGRVAHVEMMNPVKGKRLRVLFENLVWP